MPLSENFKLQGEACYSSRSRLWLWPSRLGGLGLASKRVATGRRLALGRDRRRRRGIARQVLGLLHGPAGKGVAASAATRRQAMRGGRGLAACLAARRRRRGAGGWMIRECGARHRRDGPTLRRKVQGS